MLQSIVCSYLKCFHNSLVASYRIIQRMQTFKFEYLRMLKTCYMHLCLSTLDILYRFICMHTYLFIHSGYFYSTSSSPLLLRGSPDSSINTVLELTHRIATGNCE